jgi:hypothetical protein
MESFDETVKNICELGFLKEQVIHKLFKNQVIMALNQTSGNAESAVELLLAINTNDVPSVVMDTKKQEEIEKKEECKMVLCVRNDLKMGLCPT